MFSKLKESEAYNIVIEELAEGARESGLLQMPFGFLRMLDPWSGQVCSKESTFTFVFHYPLILYTWRDIN